MEAVFFESEQAFRQWLEQNHATETVLLLGIYKKASGKPTVTYKQAVDQALCFGWIDGVGGTIDEERYTVRFTRRKPHSIWSQVNIKRVAELSDAGMMHPYGLEVFNSRDLSKQNLYANEQQQIELPAEYEAKFRANAQAWEYFQLQPPGYRRNAIWWVVSAKQEATRLKRLEILIEDSAAGRRIKSLTPRSKREGA
jgi:uncharacterized protein YdeI (YjbR/CyaY-like superfamily)